MASISGNLPRKEETQVKVKAEFAAADAWSMHEKGRHVAGESARALARRQREKAERLVKSAEQYERGADGEEATARALATLPSAEWTVFHDVRWPGRKLANVDHVAVGPGGIFVIDSKNWSGRIEVKESVLRQNGYQRETTVVGAAEAAIAVSLVTPDLPGRLAVPVLCFVRDETVVGWARDVMVCSTSNIAEMLLSRPPVLDEETRRKICLGLDLSLRSATSMSTTRPSPRGTAPSRRSASAPAPATPRRPPSRSRKKALSSGDKAKGLIGLAIVGCLLFAPTVYTGAMQMISGVITEIVTPDVEPAPVDKPAKGQKRRNQESSTTP